mgnify:CR=1 FL=1
MSYTVLARRYRSASFDAVVGQQPIARTLRAAIEQDRVAHAYLFSGTRGVGKTSMARLFADALNNPDRDERIGGAIMSGQDTDVIEIDGASNNSVDDARDLIEGSVYMPMRGHHKIYIIDEVHMLSKEAFNALLKTMEEPPEHVKFVLCTTEPHKVPPTVQSRCQRFDFRNIPAADIAGHLRDILGKEGIDAEPELVDAIARLGNGSMRDALSLLDRLIASGESRLTLRLLEELLGLPRRELLSRLIDAFAAGDPASALETSAALLDSGTGPDQLIESLLERLRDLLVLRSCGDATPLVELSDDARAEEAARARRFDPGGLVHMIAIGEHTQRSLKSSAAPRALFDAVMVRLALTDHIADAAALVGNSAAGGAARPTNGTAHPGRPPEGAASPEGAEAASKKA